MSAASSTTDKNIKNELLVFVVANSFDGSAGLLVPAGVHVTRLVERLQGHMDFVGCKFNPRQDHQEGRVIPFFHSHRSSVLALQANTDRTDRLRKFAQPTFRTPPIIREAPVQPGRTSRCALRH